MSEPTAARAPVEFDLERLLSYRLSVLSNRVSNAISSEYHRRFGLAITEWRVMAVLGRYPGLSAREVTERTAMDKVAVSRAVARLLERELIQREIHGDDRRRSVLTLSQAGISVHDEVAPMVMACQEHLVSPLSEDEREMFDRLIDKLSGEGMDAMLRHI
ncbi:MAG TPA: MarR family transcriptional regulator [Luteimonas sp.]|nr:MarR family transcriptional regulator [Luteimonas sp.]HRO27221.1 MarR family transcriptional regulator [Luteimonas sp.]HRP72631.1 MarR family transcriptional regulator [Luteimonas sp.]